MKKTIALTMSLFFSTCVFSSAEEVESPPRTLLTKSYDFHKAYLQRDEDFITYLQNIKMYLEQGESDLNADDSIHKWIMNEIERNGEGRKKILAWVNNNLVITPKNIETETSLLKTLQNTTDLPHLVSFAFNFLESYHIYMSNRANGLFSFDPGVVTTLPNKLAAHNPVDLHVARMSIDRHEAYVNTIKDAYNQLQHYDPSHAAKLIENLGPVSPVTLYVLGESDLLPDPDTLLLNGISRQDPLSMSVLKPRSAAVNVTGNSSRKERREAERKLKRAAQKTSARTVSQQKVMSSPSPAVLERIQHAVARKKALAAQKEGERFLKQQKALASWKAFLDLRAAYVAAQGEEDVSESPPCTSSSWTLPEERVREKTRGVPRPAHEIGGKRESSSPSSSSSASYSTTSSSHEEVVQHLTSGHIKRLEAFWATKAGLTYHEVASLFKALGGTVSEKRGGSSHVTLSYYTPDGKKHKHELWRPHGSNDAFGFRTTAGLHQYFNQCGFALA